MIDSPRLGEDGASTYRLIQRWHEDPQRWRTEETCEEDHLLGGNPDAACGEHEREAVEAPRVREEHLEDVCE